MFFLFFELHFPYLWRRKANICILRLFSVLNKMQGYHCAHRKCHYMLVPSLPPPHYHLYSHPRRRGRENGVGTHLWMVPPQTDRLYFKIRKDALPLPLPSSTVVTNRTACNWCSGNMQPAAEVLFSDHASVWETRKRETVFTKYIFPFPR